MTEPTVRTGSLAEAMEATGDGPGLGGGPQGMATAGAQWPRRFLRRPAGLVGLGLTVSVALVGLLAGRIAPRDPMAIAYPTFLRPSGMFWMGTDAAGRDLFSRVVHGVATSLTVVVSVVVISALIGVAVGVVSGYRGGVVDALAMRLVEMLQSVPRFLLAIVVVALLGSGYEKLILLLGLTSWTFLARMVRAEVLSLKRREFVEAARSMGAPGSRVLVRHIFPHVVPSVLVVLPLMASRIVLIEAGLAFLGLGDPNRVSLGLLISEAQPHLQYYWWLSVFPGTVLVAMVLGFNLLGDALNGVVNPLVAEPILPDRGGRWRRQRGTGTQPSVAEAVRV